MKTKMKISILAFLFIVVFMGCNSPGEKSETSNTEQKEIVVTHELGTTNVKTSPERVVVLDLGSLETLDELGVKVVGTAKRNLPQYLSKFEDDSSVTDVGTLKEVNFEKIKELNPDLIIISGRLQNSYEELSEIAPTIFVAVDNNDYLNSFEKNVRLLGEIFNKEEEAEKALADVNVKIKENQEQIKTVPGKALIVLFNNGRFSAYGKNSRFGFIHDVLGVKPAIEDLKVSSHGNAVSNEFIEQTNPDYLFIIDRGAIVNGKRSSKDEIENALIKQTNAYKNDKIIYLNPQIWYLSGGGLISINKMTDEIREAVK